MSPLQIEMLLHFYGRGDDYRDGDYSAPAVQDALSYFGHEGLIQRYEPEGDRDAAITKSYELTDRGAAFVVALMRMPLPKQIWICEP